MAVVVWISIFPPIVFLQMLHALWPAWLPGIIQSAITAAIVVGISTYVTMPVAMRMLRRWLNLGTTSSDHNHIVDGV
jgi:antibiotic biosynthesis monooxygenase (ABM) superfamily enzyme